MTPNHVQLMNWLEVNLVTFKKLEIPKKEEFSLFSKFLLNPGA
jgi:hypothetical protein